LSVLLRYKVHLRLEVQRRAREQEPATLPRRRRKRTLPGLPQPPSKRARVDDCPTLWDVLCSLRPDEDCVVL